MEDFKRGDRVIAVDNDEVWKIEMGDVGTVDEVCEQTVYVLWDRIGRKVGMLDTEIIGKYYFDGIDAPSDIAQIIEQSKLNSWDDSVEINESMDLPLDKFEFKYSDEYGRQISHKLNLKEGQYDICDIVAEVRLFLMSVGYDREDVNELIDESRL